MFGKKNGNSRKEVSIPNFLKVFIFIYKNESRKIETEAEVASMLLLYSGQEV